MENEKGKVEAVICLKEFEEGMEVHIEGTGNDLVALLTKVILKQEKVGELFEAAIEIAKLDDVLDNTLKKLLKDDTKGKD
jgi:DNA-directed RNA polymerase subunit L